MRTAVASLASVCSLATVAALGAPAFADNEVVANAQPMTSVAANVSPCDAIATLPDSRGGKLACKRISKLDVVGLGHAELYAYATRDADWTRYAIVISSGGAGASVSAPIDITGAGGMGKFDVPTKQRAKLRAITVDGVPAVAFEVHATFTHSTGDERDRVVSRYDWAYSAFVACGVSGATLECALATYGGVHYACTASMDAHGTITHRCDDTTTLTLRAQPAHG